MTTRRVLSIGQCSFDHGQLTRLFQVTLEVELVGADTTDEALARLKKEAYALVLVNRIFDQNGEGGLDFIKKLKSDETLKPTPVMLVSNFADAQGEAVEAGALPGFGKAALQHEETVGQLRTILGKRES